ncbi:hypothetical protein V491_08569, partial [Pseudogymnoascus sp. VKM F-3775]
TSTNSLALLGIIAHYFAEDGQLRESVLALRELEGRHTGANQSQLILKVIDEFGIASKVGYFIMDNAENNDTMIQSLSAALEERYIPYNAKQYRLHCNGHIINLTAQAFLFSTEDKALLEINNLSSSYIPTQLEMETWRRKGPLGKLHNIVVYIQRSPQRQSAFQKLSQGRRLLRDNKT